MNYAGDGYCRFTDTLGMSLTMPNKKYLFDSLLLKTFRAITFENCGAISCVWSL